MKLRYGTRGSALAVAQSDWAARALEAANPGLTLERVVIQTSGDRFSISPEAQRAAPDPASNVKAMFVKEIEDALLSGAIDVAVHSTKDLPAELPKGLAIGAYPEREDPRDVFIGPDGNADWSGVPEGACIATSSLRRRIQLGMARPDLRFSVIRGNVDTRLRKLKENGLGGLVLAQAGLNRLGLKVAREALPIEVMVPAPGQGALAIEARSDRADVMKVLARLDHAATRAAVECERALLKAVGGGCLTPFGAFAELKGGELSVDAFWSDPEGRHPVRRSARCAAEKRAVDGLVLRLSQDLLAVYQPR